MNVQRCILVSLAALTMACGSSTAPNQDDFILADPWTGQLLTVGGGFVLGDMTLNLEGRTDGQIEEYVGEGTLFGNRNVFRFEQVEAEYDTTTGRFEMTIIDFPTALNVFMGSYDGTRISVADTVLCVCEVTLIR